MLVNVKEVNYVIIELTESDVKKIIKGKNIVKNSTGHSHDAILKPNFLVRIYCSDYQEEGEEDADN